MTKELASKNKLTVQPYEDRPVGCPPGSDPAAMTQEEKEAHRNTVERLKELVEKVAKGDKNPLPEIRKILKESPDLAWQMMDFARHTEYHHTKMMVKEEGFGKKEVLSNQLAAMREEIAGDNPSPLERLLAERIVITWLQIQLFEGLYASNMSKGTTTIAQGNYKQKMIDQSYRRHLSAIRTLAQIRKLGPVQINIAEQQINTAG
jgi:hypothetical protein